MVDVTYLHPQATADHVGDIPLFLSEFDERRASEQFNARYSFGGGWQPMPKWKLGAGDTLTYPGDPPMKPLASMSLRGERILVYPHAFVAIIQPDGSFEVSRMD